MGCGWHGLASEFARDLGKIAGQGPNFQPKFQHAKGKSLHALEQETAFSSACIAQGHDLARALSANSFSPPNCPEGKHQDTTQLAFFFPHLATPLVHW